MTAPRVDFQTIDDLMSSSRNNTCFHYEPHLRAFLSDEGLAIWREMIAEVNAIPSLLTKHGSRHMRNQGCAGPLCKKALRDYMRGRNASSRRRRLEATDILIEHFDGWYYADWPRLIPARTA